jgi:hypothetical protein
MKNIRLIIGFGLLAFFVFIFGLSTTRHIYIGGQRFKKYEQNILFLINLLPHTIHFLDNLLSGSNIPGLIVKGKKDIKKDKFKVPGLYPYLTSNGWVILDIMKDSSSLIRINWKIFKEPYLKFSRASEKINHSHAAAPFNPIKSGQCLIFIMGDVLFKFNPKNNKINSFGGGFHHSIELFQDSLIYACKYGKDTLTHTNDAFIVLNHITGKTLYEKSIAEILLENNFTALLYGSRIISPINTDIIHLNDVQPVNMKTNFAEKGDIFLSMRNISTIMLYRPKNNKIIWLSQGPWLNQHDVDILNENEIGVYNNNYITNLGFKNNEASNVVTYNFKSNKFGTLHKNTFQKYKISSIFSSRFEVLDNGNMLVEDSPSGALYLINPNGKLLSRKSFAFKNGYVSTGVWARPYTSKPF